MIRPQGVTPAQLRAVPEVIPFTAPKEQSKSRTARSGRQGPCPT